jgi:hypothetical protein
MTQEFQGCPWFRVKRFAGTWAFLGHARTRWPVSPQVKQTANLKFEFGALGFKV